MDVITKVDIAELAKMPEAISLTIFLPTHRLGEDTLKQKDALALKNLIKSVKERLQQLGVNREEAEQFTVPVEQLVGDKAFWRQQSDTLVIFARSGWVRTYSIPVKWPTFHHISHYFFLLPLLTMFSTDGSFLLLALTLHHVRIYKCSRFGISRVMTEDFVPSRPEEVVGFDFEQKNLQFRNQGGGPSQTIFHGQGEGKEDRKEEILKFFRAVNKGLINQLNEEQLPLVVATMDHLFPIYKEANTYTLLEKNPIICNPAEVERKVLHEKAWETMRPKMEKEKKLELYRQLKGTERTETDIRKIFPKAKLGLVDSLFVHEKTGLKDLPLPTMEKDPSHQNTKLSALNQTAIAVYINGGNVYGLTTKNLRVGMANALFRY